ncbi:hypothetical protein N0V88_006753 [Collariella sp. IMI 366227]|nr:hypothetical protein N0V88_006753 [Collariella sp. IMI 366227]
MAKFYTKKHFEGDSRGFELGDRKLIVPSVTANFESVKIDKSAKAIAWQTLLHTGIYTEWKDDNSDITNAPKLLTRLAVTDARDAAVTFVFKDKTHHHDDGHHHNDGDHHGDYEHNGHHHRDGHHHNGDHHGGDHDHDGDHNHHQYTLTVESSSDLNVVLHTDTNDKRLVALLPFKSRPLGAFLEVKDEHGQDVIRRATIHFEWNSKEPGQVDVTFDGPKPKELEVDRDGATSFTICLTD